MGGSTCPKESTVTLQIKVKLNGTRDTGIDNRSSRTILTPISLRYRIEPSQRSELRSLSIPTQCVTGIYKPNVMTLDDDTEGYLG